MNTPAVRRWMLVVALLALSTAIGILKTGVWRWPVSGVSGLLALLTAALELVKQRQQDSGAERDTVARGQLLQPVPVKDASPATFGIAADVRRGRTLQLAKYFKRDAHDHLDQALSAAKARGGRIAIVGEPGSGRSRLVYEVLRERDSLQHWPLYRLSSPADLQRLPPPGDHALLWLDDLLVFLDDVGGTSPELLRKLGPVVLIGTILPEHRAVLKSPTALGTTGRHVSAWDNWRVIDVPTTLSPDEVSRALGAGKDDKQILHAWNASRSSRYGLTQTLAFAPELKKRWQDATGADRAVLHAAVDAARVGAREPLSVTFLSTAVKGYLTEAEETRLDLDRSWLTEAIERAKKLVESAPVAPLQQTPQGLLVVADYLREIGDEERKGCNPPLSLWAACAKHITDPADLHAIGSNARSRGFDGQARAIWTAAHKKGGQRSTIALAKLLSDQHRHQEAIKLLRPLARENREARRQLADELTAESRRLEATDELAAERLLEDVERLWRGLDDAEARLELAKVLEDLARNDDALAILQHAVKDGIPGAAERVGLLLRKLGDEHRLEKFWQDRGPSGFGQLASLWLERGHTNKAENILIAAVDADDDGTEDARVQLANLYLATKGPSRAEEVLKAGVRAGESASRLRLVALLSEPERQEEADELLMNAPPTDYKARHYLINRLLERHEEDEAERYSRIALAEGDPDARSLLCDALDAQHRKPDAMREWENAIAAGDQSAWYQEAEWLRGHDDINEAKRVLDEAMEAGVGDERIRELFNQLATGSGSPAASKGLKPPMRDTCL